VYNFHQCFDDGFGVGLLDHVSAIHNAPDALLHHAVRHVREAHVERQIKKDLQSVEVQKEIIKCKRRLCQKLQSPLRE